MKKFNKITPEGTKDILFEECLSQRTVSERLTHIFKMRGYNEVITPGMEYYDVFDAPNAAIPQYEMYKSTARTFPAAATKQRRRASSFWVHRG